MFLYHQAFTVSFRLSAYHPLGQDFLSNELCHNDSKSVCTLGDNDEVESIPNADACKCHLHDIVSELHKMFLSSMSTLSLKK